MVVPAKIHSKRATVKLTQRAYDKNSLPAQKASPAPTPLPFPPEIGRAPHHVSPLPRPARLDYLRADWAIGAAASASRLHRVGRGFESLIAHHFLCMNFDELSRPIDLQAGNPQDTIDELVHHLVVLGKIEAAQRDEIATAIKEREAATSTHIGRGVARPHATTGLVSQWMAVAGWSRNGILFSAPDRKL
jgi:hypothetical protein